jgi:hypothetical protein
VSAGASGQELARASGPESAGAWVQVSVLVLEWEWGLV